MSDSGNVAKSLRERFGGTTEERLGGGDLVHVGVRRGDPVEMQDTVEHRYGRVGVAPDVEVGEPCMRLALGGQRHRVDDRRSRGRYRSRLHRARLELCAAA